MRSNITVLFALLFLSVALVSGAPYLLTGSGKLTEAIGSNLSAKGKAMEAKVFKTPKDQARKNRFSDHIRQDQADKEPSVWRGNPRVPNVSTTSILAVPTGV